MHNMSMDESVGEDDTGWISTRRRSSRLVLMVSSEKKNKIVVEESVEEDDDVEEVREPSPARKKPRKKVPMIEKEKVRVSSETYTAEVKCEPLPPLHYRCLSCGKESYEGHIPLDDIIGFSEKNEEDSREEEHEEETLSVLRSMWEFPSVCTMCKMLKGVLHLPSFLPSDLEEALLHPLESNGFLASLHVRIVEGPIEKRRVVALELEMSENQFSQEWMQSVKKFLMRRVPEFSEYNPLDSAEYVDISPSARLLILYVVLNTRMDDENIRLKSPSVFEPSDAWDGCRFEELGIDSSGYSYYYFGHDIGRLFRDKPPNGRKRGCWETVSCNSEELSKFVDSFRLRNRNDRLIQKFLKSEILPILEQTENTRRKQMERQKLVELMPRKRSRRIQVLEVRRKEDERQEEELRQIREVARLERLVKHKEMREAKLKAQQEEERQRRLQEREDARIFEEQQKAQKLLQEELNRKQRAIQRAFEAKMKKLRETFNSTIAGRLEGRRSIRKELAMAVKQRAKRRRSEGAYLVRELPALKDLVESSVLGVNYEKLPQSTVVRIRLPSDGREKMPIQMKKTVEDSVKPAFVDAGSGVRVKLRALHIID